MAGVPGSGRSGVSVTADDTLLLLLPAVALMVSDLHEPLRKSARFAQFGEAIEKLDTSGLKNFGGFVGRQSVFDGYRIDEGFVFFDEKRPGFFVAGEAFFNEAFIAPDAESFLRYLRFGDYRRHRLVFSAPLRK